jgi:hypothetical protein
MLMLSPRDKRRPHILCEVSLTRFLLPSNQGIGRKELLCSHNRADGGDPRIMSDPSTI